MTSGANVAAALAIQGKACADAAPASADLCAPAIDRRASAAPTGSLLAAAGVNPRAARITASVENPARSANRHPDRACRATCA